MFKRRGSATMDTDREDLAAYYREDIGKLTEVLGRELSCWLCQEGHEGSLLEETWCSRAVVAGRWSILPSSK